MLSIEGARRMAGALVEMSQYAPNQEALDVELLTDQIMLLEQNNFAMFTVLVGSVEAYWSMKRALGEVKKLKTS